MNETALTRADAQSRALDAALDAHDAHGNTVQWQCRPFDVYVRRVGTRYSIAVVWLPAYQTERLSFGTVEMTARSLRALIGRDLPMTASGWEGAPRPPSFR